ncbi:MAG: hypothetical protein ACFCUQ_14945, partial [Kiloniellales bacterium]
MEAPLDSSEAREPDLLGPDLLDGEQFRDRFQNDRGIAVRIDRSRDARLTSFGKATLADRYLLPGESFQ